MTLKFTCESEDISDIMYVITTATFNELRMTVRTGKYDDDGNLISTPSITIPDVADQITIEELNTIFKMLNYDASYVTLVQVIANNGVPMDMFALNNGGLAPVVNEHWQFIFND